MNADIKEEIIVRPAEGVELLIGVKCKHALEVKENGIWSETVQ